MKIAWGRFMDVQSMFAQAFRPERSPSAAHKRLIGATLPRGSTLTNGLIWDGMESHFVATMLHENQVMLKTFCKRYRDAQFKRRGRENDLEVVTALAPFANGSSRPQTRAEGGTAIGD